jgi:hypothetical protein
VLIRSATVGVVGGTGTLFGFSFRHRAKAFKEMCGDFLLGFSQMLYSDGSADVVVVDSIWLVVHEQVAFNVGYTGKETVRSVSVAKGVGKW